jgi:PAS domain S-box-containing protein
MNDQSPSCAPAAEPAPTAEELVALRESERRFRQLFEIGSDYYWEMDSKYLLTYLSPNYENMFGVSIASMIGKRFSETPGLSIEPEMGRKGILAQKFKEPYRDLIFSRIMSDGTRRWFSTGAVPIFAESGKFEGYRGVTVEVTDRVRAEAEAQLARRHLGDALAYVSQPFGVFDDKDQLVTFNQAFTDLHTTPHTNTPVRHGAPYRALAEWQLEIGFFGAAPEFGRITLDLLLERFHSDREYTYQLGDGRWMLVAYRHTLSNDRVGLWTDVTALKRAEQERRRLEEELQTARRLEALGTFAGGVAHELNNALVPVLSLTRLATRQLPDGSRIKDNLKIVADAAVKARDLVEQILAFSRHDPLSGGRADLAAIASEVVGTFRSTLPSHIRVDGIIPAALAIDGDPAQLRLVLDHLIANSAQAIGERDGTITVELRPDDEAERVHLLISDTGCGMDKATETRIFEPFFTTKPVGSGLGLGLAIVHGVVSSHGGRINVTSAPGQGTVMDIALPTHASAADGELATL